LEKVKLLPSINRTKSKLRKRMIKEGAFMRYLSRKSFEGDSPSDDDIDQLFSHLEQFEPPANFVERVMAEVSRLPLPQFIPASIVDSDECTVRHHWHIPPAS
jgi:hypothetical protein